MLLSLLYNNVIKCITIICCALYALLMCEVIAYTVHNRCVVYIKFKEVLWMRHLTVTPGAGGV